MIGAHLPQCLIALHAVIADQRIHHGVLKCVAHVKAARDVGRRDHDAVRLAVASRCEVPTLLPLGIQILLDGMWIERVVHLRVVGHAINPRRWRAPI